ncbi:MAG: hypothetical protein HY304_07295 [candidate division Zixibacteria bacterium]|nr:hypothetical protein [candidate division Zixibacteria bacterium]
MEQSIERALQRIGSLEAENLRLVKDKAALEGKLKEKLKPPASRIDPPPTLTGERLSELKQRVQRLIEIVKDFERTA